MIQIFKLRIILKWLLIYGLFSLLANPAFAYVDYQQRQDFLSLEKQISTGDSEQIRQRLAELKGYPLHAYIWYQWLKKNLHLGLDIAAFQQQYPDSRYAKPLRTRQMSYFTGKKYWQSVLNSYRQGDGEIQKCQYYWAHYQTGDKAQAMQGAADLWRLGHSLNKVCDPLLKRFTASHYFTEDINWQRFKAALVNRKASLAKYLTRFFYGQDRKTAAQWLAVHNNPNKVSACINWDYSMPQSAAIFSHGVQRLARRNLDAAVEAWDARKNNFNFKFSQEQRQTVEQDLAIRLVKNRNHKANSYFKKLDFDNAQLQPWRVKAALLAQDWRQVLVAVNQLNTELIDKEKWQYWRARAHFQLGEKAEGEAIFKKLAVERSFYGFVAADHFGQDYQLNDKPIVADPLVTQQLLNNVSFSAAQEFLLLGREKMARKEWWFAISDLTTEQYKVAAKIAQKWDLPLLAVITVARAKYWDDIELRFPMAFQALIEQNARLRGLDPAIVYGLIRRESVFNPNAMSPVGARGLMQIMPPTGRTIARDLNERWRSKYDLLNVDTNIRYGTYYYNKLLRRFDGQYALAAAGYNAGPHRVKKWRPTNGAMPVDIWIELIPFNETRKYVSAVLEYALVYQARLQRKSLKMADFLTDVMPKYGQLNTASYASGSRSCY